MARIAGRQSLRRSERGSTTFEFALASAVFFLTVFGTISGGLSVYRYNMLADLAQEGARWGSVRGNTSSFSGQGTRAQMETYLRGRSPGIPLTVAVDTDPNAKAPGATLSVTVSSTWVPVSAFASWGAFAISANAKQVMAR